jgi:hypothetical protein
MPAFGGFVHTPATHISSPPHTVVQSPQYLGSIVVSTQAPPQKLRPWPQVTAQRLPTQVTVPFATAAHTAPHWPQLFASEVMSTQTF